MSDFALAVGAATLWVGCFLFGFFVLGPWVLKRMERKS